MSQLICPFPPSYPENDDDNLAWSINAGKRKRSDSVTSLEETRNPEIKENVPTNSFTDFYPVYDACGGVTSFSSDYNLFAPMSDMDNFPPPMPDFLSSPKAVSATVEGNPSSEYSEPGNDLANISLATPVNNDVRGTSSQATTVIAPPATPLTDFPELFSECNSLSQNINVPPLTQPVRTFVAPPVPVPVSQVQYNHLNTQVEPTLPPSLSRRPAVPTPDSNGQIAINRQLTSSAEDATTFANPVNIGVGGAQVGTPPQVRQAQSSSDVPPPVACLNRIHYNFPAENDFFLPRVPGERSAPLTSPYETSVGIRATQIGSSRGIGQADLNARSELWTPVASSSTSQLPIAGPSRPRQHGVVVPPPPSATSTTSNQPLAGSNRPNSARTHHRPITEPGPSSSSTQIAPNPAKAEPRFKWGTIDAHPSWARIALLFGVAPPPPVTYFRSESLEAVREFGSKWNHDKGPLLLPDVAYLPPQMDILPAQIRALMDKFFSQVVRPPRTPYDYISWWNAVWIVKEFFLKHSRPAVMAIPSNSGLPASTGRNHRQNPTPHNRTSTQSTTAANIYPSPSRPRSPKRAATTTTAVFSDSKPSRGYARRTRRQNSTTDNRMTDIDARMPSPLSVDSPPEPFSIFVAETGQPRERARPNKNLRRG
ncbi:hypothetical protein J3R30DRAFT_3407552 [Lentinula aciculospora]|uniref:Uncharacterized protein n=1 Tax=Lentinula aciculospora TaxID=153920 RepID=A0A9W9DJH0_9AGAR|nr:hypothetical protein J3R30DRAFT_3407552 [Lentinula aciculospora]